MNQIRTLMIMRNTTIAIMNIMIKLVFNRLSDVGFINKSIKTKVIDILNQDKNIFVLHFL